VGVELTGRELDKAVAEALGFKPCVVWAVLNEDESALMIDFDREAEARKWWDEHPSVHKNHHLGTLDVYQPYSELIDAAMRVVEQMRQRGHEVQIQGGANGGGWSVTFEPDSQRRATSAGPSLPDVICRAARQALLK